MPYVAGWQHRTIARIPMEGWEEAWFSFMSWRGYLQDIPGWMATRLGARELDTGEVEVHVDTLWEHQAQLARWMDGPFLPRRVIADLSTDGLVVHESVLEMFS